MACQLANTQSVLDKPGCPFAMTEKVSYDALGTSIDLALTRSLRRYLLDRPHYPDESDQEVQH